MVEKKEETPKDPTAANVFEFVIPIMWHEVPGKSLAEAFGVAFGQTLDMLFGESGALREGMTVSRDEGGEIVYTFNNPGMQALYQATQGDGGMAEEFLVNRTAAYQRRGTA